jgi:hypothetical protein
LWATGFTDFSTYDFSGPSTACITANNHPAVATWRAAESLAADQFLAMVSPGDPTLRAELADGSALSRHCRAGVPFNPPLARPKYFNKNFGMAFSFWDFLFGTAVDAPDRCRIYGVAGLNMPETILRQFLVPFRMLYRQSIANENPTTRKRVLLDKLASG